MPGGRKRLPVDHRVLMVAAVAAVGVASLASGSAAADTGAVAASLSSHVWGAAEEVPGTAALNRGGAAEIGSVSCSSAGNCGAGGAYTDSSGRGQAFVVNQVNGTWHRPSRSPAPPRSTGAGTPRSARCRAPRRATAPRPGTTLPAPPVNRRSWSARSTAPGRKLSRCPAPRLSRALGSARCRAARRATAARAGNT